MSELEKQRKERQALIEARRLKAEDPSTGGAAETPQTEEVLLPKTFKQKWENYWYHYKWVTFGGAAVVILAVFFVIQIVTAVKYDASLTIVCDFPYESVTQEIEANLLDLVEDTTGNGQKDVLVTSFYLPEDPENSGQDPTMYAATIQKLAVWPTTNDHFLYLLNDTAYQHLSNMGMEFMDLSRELDNPRIKGDKYYIKDTKLEEKLLADGSSSELYLCFYNYYAFSEQKQNQSDIKTAYEQDWAFLKSMIAYE